MAHSGKIKSYDAGKGHGTITPEKGGEALSFHKAGLQQQAQEPKVGQRYNYETKQVDGGRTEAVSMQQEQGQNQKGQNQKGQNDKGQKEQASSQQG